MTPFGKWMEALKSLFSVLAVQSSSALCVQAGGRQKKKRRQRKRRGPGGALHQADTNHLLGLGILGQVLFAAWARAQGCSGGQGPWQITCVHKPDAVKRRRSRRWKRVEGRSSRYPAATISAPRGLRLHTFTRMFVRSIKEPQSRASSIIKKWWKAWIAGADGSAGSRVKQSWCKNMKLRRPEVGRHQRGGGGGGD